CARATLQRCAGARRAVARPRDAGPTKRGKMRGFPVVAPAWPLLMQAPTVMPTPVVIPVEISFRLNLDLQTATFYDLQREVRREARQALLRALRASLVEVEKALVAEPILCPGCQVPMRSRGRTVRRIVTVFGSLPVRRARYGCATCGTVRRPLDEWIGLAEGTEYTAAVREQVLYLSADLPYERAADVLRHVDGRRRLRPVDRSTDGGGGRVHLARARCLPERRPEPQEGALDLADGRGVEPRLERLEGEIGVRHELVRPALAEPVRGESGIEAAAYLRECGTDVSRQRPEIADDVPPLLHRQHVFPRRHGG